MKIKIKTKTKILGRDISPVVLLKYENGLVQEWTEKNDHDDSNDIGCYHWRRRGINGVVYPAVLFFRRRGCRKRPHNLFPRCEAFVGAVPGGGEKDRTLGRPMSKPPEKVSSPLFIDTTAVDIEI